MSFELENNTFEGTYRVESVEKTDPPQGIPAGDWHRYIIGRGNSKIEGLKPGSFQAVTEHAESVAEDLNERATKYSSVYYVSRKRK